ncbi:mur ligase middle domain protein [Mycobacterium ulcerans str. Harvey]|uniref:Mur ligase middle domain protein n=1 Tax=Mycobacterium ulcerans str. Harvey TaxID=1299332 RepID=A0ABP3ADV7_MYCUL|nr:mur ligase middle domain protein [Mycobacterium ulcerans str. Harvey]
MTAEQLPPELQRVHMVGIGGAGMAGIARILLDRGGLVSGSDAKESRGVHALRARGALIRIGHDASALDLLPGGVTSVITTHAAIPKTNPELVEARRRGVPVMLRPVVLAKLMDGRITVMVTGTHGKTTTTSMAIVALQHCGRDPSFAVGGELGEAGTNAHHGSGDYFVAEADESDGSLLEYTPHVAVVTNIEADHLDFYGSTEAYVGVFDAFVERLAPGGALVVCADDPGSAALAERSAELGIRVLRYGSAGHAGPRWPRRWCRGNSGAPERLRRSSWQARRTHARCGFRCPGGTWRSMSWVRCWQRSRSAPGRRGARRPGRFRGGASAIRTGRDGGIGAGFRRLRAPSDRGQGDPGGGPLGGSPKWQRASTGGISATSIFPDKGFRRRVRQRSGCR